MLLILVASFGSYPLLAAHRWRRLHSGPAVGARTAVLAWALAASGLASVIGLNGYFFVLLMNNLRVGPVIAGRPLPWLVLQLSALATAALSMLLLWSGSVRRADLPSPVRRRLLPLVGGGLLFMPWGLYWGLLLP
ncbi:MAG: hypothetical protein HGA45_05185 [Chloroflexales bacterium]|nr:hypothetical protein [Chloroflexales bacterium]